MRKMKLEMFVLFEKELHTAGRFTNTSELVTLLKYNTWYDTIQQQYTQTK